MTEAKMIESRNNNSSSDNSKSPDGNGFHQAHDLGVSDFLLGASVGVGSFGHVCYARRKRPAGACGGPSPKEDNEEYAIKIMDKYQIIKEKRVQAVMLEKNILLHYAIRQGQSSCDSNNNFIIRLHGAFHDSQHLYLLLDLCWGTLSDIVPFTCSYYHYDDSTNHCNSSLASAYVFYYMGQTIRALEYLHSNGIIHCDLKPDNILLTRHGRIRLSDFGAAIDMKNICATNANSNSTSNSTPYQQPMVGSMEYISPEMIKGESILTPSTDLWALGCILCLLLYGATPFQDSNLCLVIKRIMEYASNPSKRKHWTFPRTSFPPHSGDKVGQHNIECIQDELTGQQLIALLLHPIPAQRIGSMDQIEAPGATYHSIRSHSFFDKPGWKWEALPTADPPYRPPQPNWYLSSDAEGGAAYLMDGGTEFDQWLMECH